MIAGKSSANVPVADQVGTDPMSFGEAPLYEAPSMPHGQCRIACQWAAARSRAASVFFVWVAARSVVYIVCHFGLRPGPCSSSASLSGLRPVRHGGLHRLGCGHLQAVTYVTRQRWGSLYTRY
jgi:hypothetical protein